VIVVAAGLCAGVAGVLDRPVWAAALGAGLVLLTWILDTLAWRQAGARERGLALDVALGGLIVRLAVSLGALVAIGLLARPAFATAALSFVAAFTAYLPVRTVALVRSGAHREART
jgi:hypothetical protein